MGETSFVPELLTAFEELISQQSFNISSIPRLHAAFEMELATGELHAVPDIQLDARVPVVLPSEVAFATVRNWALHDPALRQLSLPDGLADPISTLPLQKASIILNTYPPRRTMQLLDKQHTHGERPAFEKIIVEDYILDMMATFEENRVDCAKRLAQGARGVAKCGLFPFLRAQTSKLHCTFVSGITALLPTFLTGLPVPFQYEPLLCQTIYCQMLGLPKPKFRPILYGALMVDLCKLCKLFPRAMSACVRYEFNLVLQIAYYMPKRCSRCHTLPQIKSPHRSQGMLLKDAHTGCQFVFQIGRVAGLPPVLLRVCVALGAMGACSR